MSSIEQPAKIGLLNLSSHENFLSDLAEIAAISYEVTIYTTPGIEERIKGDLESTSGIEWATKDETEPKKSYLNRVEEETSEETDALIAFPFYGNIFDFPVYAGFSPSCLYYQIAYEINGWVGNRPTITREFYNFAKYPFKRRILDRIDTLLVEFDPIRKYAQEHVVETNVETFTPVVSNNSTEGAAGSESDDGFVVTVPGIIDSTRRDYDVALNAVGKLPPECLDSVEVVFLGNPRDQYGKQVIEKADKLERDGAKVTYFRDWIPTETFEEHLRRTDILLSPLRQTRQINGFIEEYGLSKGSGAISDAIREGTPLILPSWFNVPDQVEPGVRTFEGQAGLTELLREILSSVDKRNELRDGAARMSKEYTVRRQNNRLTELLQDQK